MIQRPQTLFFLAIVAICLMLMFSDTIFYKATNTDKTAQCNVEYDETEIIATDGNNKVRNTWLFAFSGAIGIISIVSLLMFKNRKLQLLLSSYNFLFILGLIVMMYMYSIHMNYFDGSGDQNFTFSALLPIALIFLNFLAIKGVKKDEQLIRSMDRLR